MPNFKIHCARSCGYILTISGPDGATDLEQRLKKADLFISDFVPTEYTGYIIQSHEKSYSKVHRVPRALLVEPEDANQIIVNEQRRKQAAQEKKESPITTTTTTSTTTTTTITTTTTTTPTTTTTITTEARPKNIIEDDEEVAETIRILRYFKANHCKLPDQPNDSRSKAERNKPTVKKPISKSR
jgi:hypothetical protein